MSAVAACGRALPELEGKNTASRVEVRVRRPLDGARPGGRCRWHAGSGVERLCDAAAHQHTATTVALHERAAPLDAELLECVAVDNYHLRRDLDLGQRNIELLLDEASDALDVGGIVSDEDRVRRLVGADGQPLRQDVGGRNAGLSTRTTGWWIDRLAFRRDIHGRRRREDPGWRDLRGEDLGRNVQEAPQRLF